MQSLRSLLAPAVLTAWMCSAPSLTAQEADPAPASTPAAEPSAESSAPAEARPERRPRRRRGRRRPRLTVIEAGHVHPVSGPVIKDGIVVIRGERILAIGKQGDLRLPANTEVHKFPDGHVYPGLIDAATDAFTDRGTQADGSLNGGSKLSDGLLWVGDRDDQLAAAGITTAYVTVRSGAQLPGQGAIVRPQQDGFALWEDREQAALQLRMTTGAGASHPLQRQAQLEGVNKLFDSLEKYREGKDKFDEELEKYQKDFEAYLEHHQKKNGKDKKSDKPNEQAGKGDAKKTAGEKPAGRGKKPSDEPAPKPKKDKQTAADQVTDEQFEAALTTLLAAIAEQNDDVREQPTVAAPTSICRARRGPRQQGPQGEPGASKAKGAGDKKGADKDKGPKRPTYPKKPRTDDQKEALLRVLDGELPLRVRAHRRDELHAVLRMQREQEIPLLVIEEAFAADAVAEQIANQGATVVLTNLLPNSLKTSTRKSAYDAFDPTALPAKLNDAGVPFAIASGKARLASLLPLMAAAAVGRGLPEDAALRAITLTPAEILGVQKDTGSLARGKYGDVLVTDGPLLATDSRVLMVLSRGRTQFDAQAAAGQQEATK